MTPSSDRQPWGDAFQLSRLVKRDRSSSAVIYRRHNAPSAAPVWDGRKECVPHREPKALEGEQAGMSESIPSGFDSVAQQQNDIASDLESVYQTREAKAEVAVMNAYLFSAGCTITQIRPVPGRGGQMENQLLNWDHCVSAIVYGGEAEQAQKRFEDWLSAARDTEHPAQVDIKKLVAAQFMDQLLTESGGKPLDWPQLVRQLTDLLQDTALDDFEQGYWVDINQTLPPGKISSGIESLKADLPEDIRSGLNWSPDRQFFFVVSVLSSLPMPTMPADEPETAASDPDSAEDETGADAAVELDGHVTSLAEMRDREAAVLVQARNSVVAAWLWRKFAADTQLALNEVHIMPCRDLISAE